MPRRISSASSLDTFRKEARRWLKALRAGEAGALERLNRAWPGAPAAPTLRDVQHALAREYGFDGWTALRQAVETSSAAAPSPLLSRPGYEQLAADIEAAFNARDEAALARFNAHYRRTFSFDDLGAEVWRRVYSYRQRANRTGERRIEPGEARGLIAQDAGFGTWAALLDATDTGAPPLPAFAIDEPERRIAPRRFLSDREWDRIVEVMRDRNLTGLEAGGLMTDAVMSRVATLEHVTSLDLSGSRQLTDEGLRHLERLPQLERLNLTGAKISDRGLEVLRALPNLREFSLTWQRDVTDAGIAHLRGCDRLERVDLMGSPVGDGAIVAMTGKAHLRSLSTGRLVTDAGLARLREIPRFAQPPSGAPDAEEVHLLIDGPFTAEGLAGLAELAGVNHLDLFWHVTKLDSNGFAHLVRMPNLMMLGADGPLSDDRSLAHIAAIPRLRQLRAQEAAATDAGFEALASSKTLEGFWGRECAGFGTRAFRAFARLPKLRSLGVGLGQVDADALAALPDFPALRELTPIGLKDDAFRHIGRCVELERLTCMYCRESGDDGTAELTGLSKLRYYYAGLTQITDRSLAVLGRLPSLEQAEFYECLGITNAGLPALAAAPALKEVALEGLPGVTLEGTKVFPKSVRVRYST